MRRYQRSVLCPFRQVLQEAMHNFEDLFRRLLIVRDLHCQRPRLGDRLQKISRSDVSCNAQLSRLEHDVATGAAFRILHLRPVRSQPYQSPSLCPHFQQSRDQAIPHLGGRDTQVAGKFVWTLQNGARRSKVQIPS